MVERVRWPGRRRRMRHNRRGVAGDAGAPMAAGKLQWYLPAMEMRTSANIGALGWWVGAK